MAFNLKKAQVQVPINMNGNPQLQNAVAKILATYRDEEGELYDTIEEYMYDSQVTAPQLIAIGDQITPEVLENSVEVVRGLENAGEQIEQIQNAVPGVMGNSNNKIKTFNLKTSQQFNYQEQPVSVPQEQQEIQLEQQDVSRDLGQEKSFNTHSDLKDFLVHYQNDRNPFQKVWPVIQVENPKYPDDAQSGVKNFYVDLKLKSDEQQLDEANEIYNLIYGKEEEDLTMNLPYGSPEHISQVNNEIIKIAKNIKKEEKSFNLKKIAQHKGLENVIMWGPGQTRIDPFLHQPVSDWHIVERNKGFGLVVDDVWNIDYETIWRENIMDKYSRPYKDKEGNWVGGYIQKRFEVDKNIPVTNNMQLKPGELRKPILPEYGNTESRLQAARAKGDIPGAYNTTKPFNWKDASSKKKSLIK